MFNQNNAGHKNRFLGEPTGTWTKNQFVGKCLVVILKRHETWLFYNKQTSYVGVGIGNSYAVLDIWIKFSFSIKQ